MADALTLARELADELVAAFGVSVSLERVTATSFDAATGVTTPTVSAIACSAVRGPTQAAPGPGMSGAHVVETVYRVRAEDVGSGAVRPEPGWRVVETGPAGTVRWRVVRVEDEVSLGDAAARLYALYCRDAG